MPQAETELGAVAVLLLNFCPLRQYLVEAIGAKP